MKTKEIPYIIILLFAVYFSFFYNIGSIPLFNLDEGAFSEATRQMIESGNFLTTYLNEHLRFDKPILIYWLQAYSIHFFGLNEFALRLPSAISASLWAMAIYLFVRYFYDYKKAFFSSFIMITSLQISIIADAAIADALLNLFIALSMFFIYLYWDKRENKYIYLTFASIGFGTLTKGPVAIMIPFVVSLIFFSINKEFKLWIKTILNPKGILIFLAITLPWYLLEYIDQGQKFIDGFFLKNNLQRFDSSLEHHKGSIFYFIPVLIIGLMPWTLQLFKSFKVKTNLEKYLLIWFGFVFLFFSFSGTKLPHYVIYGYTGIIILMATREFFDYKYMVIFPITLLFLLFLFPIVIDYIHIKDHFFNYMMQTSSKFFDIGYRGGLVVSMLILFSLIFVKISNTKKLIIMGFVFIFTINSVVMPTIAKIKEQPIKNLALFVKKNYPNSEVCMKGINVPTFSVYVEKITPHKDCEIILTKAYNKYENYTPLKKDGAYMIMKQK